jgi:hypothetical protein
LTLEKLGQRQKLQETAQAGEGRRRAAAGSRGGGGRGGRRAPAALSTLGPGPWLSDGRCACLVAQAMLTIKAVLDPLGIINPPGKLGSGPGQGAARAAARVGGGKGGAPGAPPAV